MPGFDQLHDRRHGGEHVLQPSRYQIARGLSTLVGDVCGIDVGAQTVQITRHVSGRSDARRTIIYVSCIGFGVGHEFRHGVDTHGRWNHQNSGYLGNQRDRLQFGLGVDVQVFEQGGIDGNWSK